MEYKKIIEKEESKNLEVKATFGYDIIKEAKNNCLKEKIVGIIVAFMNTDDGDILIDVDNNQTTVGIEKNILNMNLIESNHIIHVFCL